MNETSIEYNGKSLTLKSPDRELLTEVRIQDFTVEEIEKLKEKVRILEEESKQYKNQTEKQIWTTELKEFVTFMKSNKKDNKQETKKAPTLKTKGKGKAKK